MQRGGYQTEGASTLFGGGFEFTADDVYSRQAADAGYAKGVPMGGELHTAPKGKAPSFLVAALKDPLSWTRAAKPTRRSTTSSGATPINARSVSDGKLTPVRNTVDAKTATWTNTIRDPELVTVWTDPNFDPSLSAFYYARVLEIPTPRWTTYDAVRFNVKMAPEIPVSIQERAYTSPVWYKPG